MRKLLNTVYITTPDIYISKEGETIVFTRKKEKIMQLPSHNIEGIVIFEQTVITPHLMEMCAEKNIKVSFISYTGRFLVGIQSPIKGNVRLRRIQYRISDDKGSCVEIAKHFVIGKIYNSRVVFQRLLRDHGEKVNRKLIEKTIQSLAISINAIERIDNIDSLRGIEGEAAKNYYGSFEQLISNEEFKGIFKGRNRRPPTDEVNALLSFFYTLLAHDCEAALETVGLDPQVGFYHQERPGRVSLALDMMEELRPYLVDRFVISLINTKQIKRSDFVIKENDAVLIKPESRGRILQVWQSRKQEEVTHPFLKEKIEIGLIPYSQALLMTRYLRGDMDGYPPFLMR
jgi:CRISPR-associated protein Cas1